MRSFGVGDAIEFLLVGGVYWFIFVLPTALGIGLVQELDPPLALKNTLFVLFGVWYLAAGWFAAKAAAHRVRGGGFGQSMFAGVPEARAALSYLPVVGRYLGPRSTSPSDGENRR